MAEPNSRAAGAPADYHRGTARSFWPDEDEYAAAKTALGQRGRYISDYLRACLRWLTADPSTALETLREHWPPPRRPGRPRKKPEGVEASASTESEHKKDGAAD